MILINNNICGHQISITPTHQTLKDGEILGSDNRGEVDLDSDVNFLDSGKIQQSNTVPSQCERFPYP